MIILFMYLSQILIQLSKSLINTLDTLSTSPFGDNFPSQGLLFSFFLSVKYIKTLLMTVGNQNIKTFSIIK